MAYLAFNKKILKRLSYHVIWGLRIDVAGARTLYKDVKHLRQHPEALALIVASQIAMMQYRGFLGFIVRALCWAFNWRQYRANYYKLQAYYSWSIYEKGQFMLTNDEQRHAAETGGFLVRYTPFNGAVIHALGSGFRQAKDFLGEAVDTIISPVSWAGQRIISRVIGNRPLDTVDLNIRKTHFLVTEAMCDKLHQLGIEAIAEQLISHEELKDAYKKTSLRVHPDKPEGSTEKFQQIKQVYDELVQLIKDASDPLGLRADIEQIFVEMDEKLDSLDYGFKLLRKQGQKYGEKVDAHAANVKRHCVKVKATATETTALFGEFEKLKALVEESDSSDDEDAQSSHSRDSDESREFKTNRHKLFQPGEEVVVQPGSSATSNYNM